MQNASCLACIVKMTSDKILLKEALRSKLDRSQERFVGDKLGNGHPLTALHQIRTTKSALDLEVQKNSILAAEIGRFVRSRSTEIRKHASLVKEIERLDVGSVVDDLAELKDSVDNVRSDMICSMSTLCESDVVE